MAKVNNYINEAYHHLTDPVFAKYTQDIQQRIDFYEYTSHTNKRKETKVGNRDGGNGSANLKIGNSSYCPSEQELDKLELLLEFAQKETEEKPVESTKYMNEDDVEENYDLTLAFLKKYKYNIV